MSLRRSIVSLTKRVSGCVIVETLIVLDATTGQNALAQAKEFNEVTDITGIVLTNWMEQPKEELQ